MATFLLVHGAWHGGWCWKRVAKRLSAKGHLVYAPTLTGLGERSHLAGPEIDLSCHIKDILAVLDTEELSDVIICGHSYGGQIITPVIDQRIKSFHSGVWLDAFVPEDGQSLLDNWSPERIQKIREKVLQVGDGWKIPPMKPEYFGVMNQQDIEWVRRRCVPQPFKTFSEPVQLTGTWQSLPRKFYILAELHPNSNFKRFSAPLSQKPDWDVRSIPSGHDIMVDKPDILAKMLLEIANL